MVSNPLPTPAPAPGDASTTGTGGTDLDELAPAPASPSELAAALTEAEQAIRQLGVDPSVTARWGRRQQHLYGVLSANPDWGQEVMASIDPSVSEAASLNWKARQALDSLLRTEALLPTLPAWRIDEPRPADELLGYYHEASDATGVPWSVLAAINLVETKMGRINGLSTAGAVGPMQFLPSTWAECCEGDPTNEPDAIRGAAEYLIDRGGATNLDRAIFGYNNSDHYVSAVQAYAAVLDQDEWAYHGYHAWEVYYRSSAGLVRLPVGYEQTELVDAATWIEANQADLVPTP
ncbi:MAG: lytic transglycosylase domain-containing protein [Actinomycetia bacterium]|nr:lytic transglycosylase domain-containing protein [Actinomycetes bacterium]MCP5034844.1 lytic transglycosylase domain-containing protein [Actinomycetes bacterium]